MISEVCGREHETVGMSSILGDHADGRQANALFLTKISPFDFIQYQVTTIRTRLGYLFTQFPSTGAPIKAVMVSVVPPSSRTTNFVNLLPPATHVLSIRDTLF